MRVAKYSDIVLTDIVERNINEKTVTAKGGQNTHGRVKASVVQRLKTEERVPEQKLEKNSVKGRHKRRGKVDGQYGVARRGDQGAGLKCSLGSLIHNLFFL